MQEIDVGVREECMMFFHLWVNRESKDFSSFGMAEGSQIPQRNIRNGW
jgi:hypothetical protein